MARSSDLGSPASMLFVALYALEQREDSEAESLLRTVMEQKLVPELQRVASTHFYALRAVTSRDLSAVSELRKPPPDGARVRRKHAPRASALFTAATLIAEGKIAEAREKMAAVAQLPKSGWSLWLEDRVAETFSADTSIDAKAVSPAK